MTAARLVLWRHGQTDWNLSGQYQGQADLPLNETGLAQARATAPYLVPFAPARLVTSDLVRARRTAEEFAALTGLVPQCDRGLREVDVGTWAGLTNEVVFAEVPEFQAALRDGRDFRRSPTGETGAEAGGRVAAAIRAQARATPDGETLLVVGHGFSLRVAITLLLGLDFAHNRLLSGLWNCSWSVLQGFREHWRLQSYNNHVPAVSSGVGAHNIS